MRRRLQQGSHWAVLDRLRPEDLLHVERAVVDGLRTAGRDRPAAPPSRSRRPLRARRRRVRDDHGRAGDRGAPRAAGHRRRPRRRGTVTDQGGPGAQGLPRRRHDVPRPRSRRDRARLRRRGLRGDERGRAARRDRRDARGAPESADAHRRARRPDRVPARLVEVAPGVRRLGPGLVNVYLLEEAGEVTIVDAGAPGYWNDLPAELAAMGRTMGDVRALVLTHAHADHVGFAERLRRERRVPVRVHELDGAFSGDAFATLNVLSGDRGPRLSPFNADIRRAYESLARLDRLEARVALPGHGEPWTGGIAEALRLVRERGVR